MRPLKALFVQLGFHKDFPDVSTLATTYNDGLYYVASFLMRELPNLQADICQMFWGENPDDYPLSSYDYILVSALATHFWSNLPALESIRSGKRADTVVIMGGPHATFAPYEALRFADYVILGEGEIPALALIVALEAGGDLDKVENLCRLGDDGALHINRFARFTGLDNSIQPSLLARAPKLHWATVSMSRGCPYNCSFCYAIRILGRRFRTKNLDTVVAELEGIHQQTGCNRFYVTDLNFTTRKDFCHAVAGRLRNHGFHFIAMSRVDVADDVELLLDLRDSGFREYCLGVESEDPGVLKSFNKKVEASLQTERLQRFAEHDIYTHSAIIFGLDLQDAAAIERTAAWCAEARIVHPTFVCLAEYPFQNLLFGSRQDIEDHRIIMEVPTYQHYSFVGIFPRHIRASDLQRCIIRSYEVFFERAFALETRPSRRARLKSYARSVKVGIPGMERHVRFLEALEKPYYTASGELRENRLLEDFAARHGALREWLAGTVRHDPSFEQAFAQ